MSKTHKVSIVLALTVLAALGVSLIRGWPPLASAAGRAQSLETDTLFFVSDPRSIIQRVAASEPRRLAEQTASAATESIPLDTGTCGIAGLYASPNGCWVAVEVGCEASVHTLIMAATTGEVRPAWPEAWQSSFFLNWDPAGDLFLVRVGHLGESAVFLVNAQNGRFEQIDTPPFTYAAVFSPEGERVLYATTQGLGFGSEAWLMDRNGRNREQIINAPAHIIAYPRWSPSGDSIAYIRMADSNVPFTVGELVLADGSGRNERVIAPVDAGHGYPPVWSPDGRHVAFVVRENPENRRADVIASALESNIYVADVALGGVRALTAFEGALTETPAWSPDGAWLAFSTDIGDGPDIWLAEAATGAVYQVTQNAYARFPIWVAGRK